jgi:hypothetical protein
VAGPLDILGYNGRGVADDMPFTVAAVEENLTLAIEKALRLDRTAAAVFGAALHLGARNRPVPRSHPQRNTAFGRRARAGTRRSYFT